MLRGMHPALRTAWIGAALAATAWPQEPESSIEWRTDLAAATEEAERDGRPMLVVFR